MFSSLVLKASVQHYFPTAVITAKEGAQIQELLQKLTYKPKKS